MRALLFLFVALVMLAAPSVHGSPAAAPPDPATLLSLAEAARATGRPAEARKALLYVLVQRPGDPLALGRLGVLDAEAGAWPQAAKRLYDALQANAGATEAERESFGKWFARARNEVAVVRVAFVEAPDVVHLDGLRLDALSGQLAWFQFVAPGAHVLDAERRGSKVYHHEFTVERGETVPLRVAFEPESPAPSVAAPAAAATGSRPKPDPTPPQRSLYPTQGWISGGVLAGGWMAPGVAVGATLGAGVAWGAPRGTVFAGLELRGLVGLGTIERAPPITPWTFGVALPGCGRVASWFWCAVPGFDLLMPQSRDASTLPTVYLGVRGGRAFGLGSTAELRAWAQVDVRSSIPTVKVDWTAVWSAPPVALSLGFAAGWFR